MKVLFRVFLIFNIFFSLNSCSNVPQYAEITGFAQGGTYNIRCKIPSTITSSELKSLVDIKLAEIDNSISGYNKESILFKVNSSRGEEVLIDTIFTEVFNISYKIWKESNGVFDPSSGSLFDLWGYGFEDKEIDTTLISELLQHIGMDLFEINSKDGNTYIKKIDPEAKLNFNAIAQGFSCDLIAKIFEEMGCYDYLIEIGGEIICKGESPRGGDWRIWIDKPVDGNNVSGEIKQDIISLSDCSIVTSGNYRKFYYKDGEKYSHTINPKTGFPVQHTLLSATVLADDGATADAYATWFMVIGLEEAKELAMKLGVGAYFVYGSQDNMCVWYTDGLKLEGDLN